MIVVAGQSLLDIAVQTAGSVEAVFELATANDMGVADDLKAGASLVIPQVYNRTIADYFRANGLIPKSGIRPSDLEVAPYGGIGYMGVEVDFIVS